LTFDDEFVLRETGSFEGPTGSIDGIDRFFG
jgi:hypothetical protein